jgi:hypothetical protein
VRVKGTQSESIKHLVALTQPDKEEKCMNQKTGKQAIEMISKIIQDERESKEDKVTDPNHKIMTKPLPDILDELEDWIKKVEEATRKAEAATIEAKKAAGEAKLAGEKAAGEAVQVAVDKMATLESRLQKKLDDLDAKISQVAEFAQRINSAQVNSLNAAVKAYNDIIS